MTIEIKLEKRTYDGSLDYLIWQLQQGKYTAVTFKLALYALNRQHLGSVVGDER